MPDVDVPQTGEPIQVLPSGDVFYYGAAATDIDKRLDMVNRMMQRMDQVAPVFAEMMDDGTLGPEIYGEPMLV